MGRAVLPAFSHGEGAELREADEVLYIVRHSFKKVPFGLDLTRPSGTLPIGEGFSCLPLWGSTYRH